VLSLGDGRSVIAVFHVSLAEADEAIGECGIESVTFFELCDGHLELPVACPPRIPACMCSAACGEAICHANHRINSEWITVSPLTTFQKLVGVNVV